MNAVVTQDTPRLPSMQSGGQVRAIVPQTFDEAWRIANAVCIAGMAPKGLDTPEKAMVAIMHGLEVGFTPMAALQSIAVVNGRPTIWGDGALGLCRASPKCEYVRERIEGDGDNMVAICEVGRRGEQKPIVGRFSVDDAKKASLWGKQGPWQQYPKRMLAMRARAFALRDGFADVLRGLGIAEEVADFQLDGDVSPRPARPVPPRPNSVPPKPNGTPLSADEIAQQQQTPANVQQNDLAGKDVEDAEVEDEIPEHDSETGEVAEDSVDESEPVAPSDMLTALDDELAVAGDEATVMEIWGVHDLPARLTQVPNGDEFIAIAKAVRDRHLKRVRK